jgi:hypothetical protein
MGEEKTIMSMTKEAMFRDAARLSELLRSVFDAVMDDHYQARLRVMELDDHDLKVFARLINNARDLATSELESRGLAIRLNAEGRTIIFDDQARQRASSFVGLCRDDDPDRPYLAITIRESRRFKGGQRAAKWYSRSTGANYRTVIEAISKDKLIAQGAIPKKGEPG